MPILLSMDRKNKIAYIFHKIDNEKQVSLLKKIHKKMNEEEYQIKYIREDLERTKC